tara:strand:+ start:8 stop:364 length:357 start_codon:yes stop_codon:yes gene_type:complete
MGIIVEVLRGNHDPNSWLGDVDCTNGGITNHKNGVHQLTIMNAEGPFEPTADAPAAVIKLTPYGQAKIVPWDAVRDDAWTMMGGNYAATSDSRFNEAINKMTGQDFYGAVPIHDRIEG